MFPVWSTIFNRKQMSKEQSEDCNLAKDEHANEEGKITKLTSDDEEGGSEN